MDVTRKGYSVSPIEQLIAEAKTGHVTVETLVKAEIEYERIRTVIGYLSSAVGYSNEPLTPEADC